MSDKQYCYPPDYTVLKNKANLRDSASLEMFERLNSGNRALDIPFDTPISEPGFRSIHKEMFQDVYDWAGDYRKIDISKGSRFELFGNIPKEMSRVFTELRAEDNLKGLDVDQFAGRAAVYLDDLNITHPFRDGNGRTQRFFLRNLANQAGHELHLERIGEELWMKGSIESMHRSNYEPMKNCIRGAIGEVDREKETKNRSASKEEYLRDALASYEKEDRETAPDRVKDRDDGRER